MLPMQYARKKSAFMVNFLEWPLVLAMGRDVERT